MMHLYTPDGRPVYDVPYADKKRANKTRPATLADARKLGLYPSVTEILGIIDKPGLRAWRDRMVIEAALTQPADGRPVDDLVPEIRANADEFSRAAMELGTKYHDAIESLVYYIDGKADAFVPEPDVSLHTMEVFRGWYEAHVTELISAEESFAHPLGFAGRLDWFGKLDGNLTVIDWKTQGTKEGNRFRFYATWAAQLAAYAYGIGCDLSEVDLVSVVISTTEPGRIKTKTWDHNAEYFSAFCDAFRLWQGPLGKNFNPAENARKIAA